MNKRVWVLCAALSLSACNKEVGQKVVDFLNDMVEISEANKDDCSKMGTELKTYIEKHKGVLEESKAWAKQATAEENKAMFAKYKDAMTTASGKLMSGMGKCLLDKGVQAALSVVKEL